MLSFRGPLYFKFCDIFLRHKNCSYTKEGIASINFLRLCTLAQGILPSFLTFIKAMFEQKENSEEAKVDIKEIDPDTLEKLIAFIYTDFVNDFEIDAELFVASEKYAIERLRFLCENNLCKKIDVSNAADLYRLAYLHEASRWQKYCENLAFTFYKEIKLNDVIFYFKRNRVMA